MTPAKAESARLLQMGRRRSAAGSFLSLQLACRSGSISGAFILLWRTLQYLGTRESDGHGRRCQDPVLNPGGLVLPSEAARTPALSLRIMNAPRVPAHPPDACLRARELYAAVQELKDKIPGRAPPTRST